MSAEHCYVDKYLQTLTVSQRRLMIAASGESADNWHPLMRDLFRFGVLDLCRIIEGEEQAFEAIAEAPRNAELALLDGSFDFPDPDADDAAPGVT